MYANRNHLHDREIKVRVFEKHGPTRVRTWVSLPPQLN